MGGNTEDGVLSEITDLDLPTVEITKLKGWTYIVKGVFKSPNYGIFIYKAMTTKLWSVSHVQM